MASKDLIIKGHTVKEIVGAKENSNYVTFHCENDIVFIMSHEQDCCEHVLLEEVYGDINTLINTPILDAYISCSEEVTADKHNLHPYYQDNHYEDQGDVDIAEKWTFYVFRTMQGTVTFRWYGAHNGNYSTRVDFYQEGLEDDDPYTDNPDDDEEEGW